MYQTFEQTPDPDAEGPCKPFRFLNMAAAMRASGVVATCLLVVVLVVAWAGSSAGGQYASVADPPTLHQGGAPQAGAYSQGGGGGGGGDGRLHLQLHGNQQQQQQGPNGFQSDDISTSSGVFDQIVVGAGIVGLWIANELAKAGQKVLLLEQFPRCHGRGGSAGSSRAIELTYPIPAAIPSFKAAMQMYEDLQYETGVEVLKDTKVLLLTEEPFESTPMPEVKNVLEKDHGITLPRLDSAQLAADFPGFGFTEQSHAIYDNVTAKEFLASKAVYALWTALEARGVKTADACAVTSVETEPTFPNVPLRNGASNNNNNLMRVACRTGNRSFLGKTVILATGAWTQSIQVFGRNGRVPLPEVVPMLTAQLYFKIKTGAVCADVGFMDWQWQISNDMFAWGRPSYNTQTDQDYLIGLGDKVDVDNPSDMESPAEFRQTVDQARDYVRRRMPCLDDNPTLIERAMLYRTNTKNRGVRPLEGIDNVYLAIEGNSFGGSPTAAKAFVTSLLNGRRA